MGMGLEKDNRSRTNYDVFGFMKLFIAIYSRNPTFGGLSMKRLKKSEKMECITISIQFTLRRQPH
jgi:hypothetical protein